jgi:uncharacterized cupredoxin-like copper-binding protein
MRKITASTVVAAILAGLPNAIHSPVAAAPTRTMVVSAYEFAFKAPDSIAAGVVTVRLVDHGTMAHQVALARLDDTSSLARVMRTLTDDKVHTSGIRWVGGVESAIPGESSDVTLPLTSGRYIIVCAYASDSGPSHVSRGMIRALVVTPGPAVATPSLPPAPTTIELSDYHFGISAPLHSGKQLVRVVNVGKHHHQLMIGRIVGNATTEQIMSWDGKSLPAPLQDMSGGVSAMDPGQAANIELDLTPGRYELGCIMTDGAGSKPHYLLGMHDEISVR